MNKKLIGMVAVLAGGAVMLAGCNGNNNTGSDTHAAAAALQQYDVNQPVPKFNWSQLRQNLIEIQSAQANTTQTTSFFYVRGGAESEPVDSCPSIGFPIPVTDQLTNPQQRLTNHEAVVAQIEQTGVYTGDSSGTYVICLDGAAGGKAYINYWEGDVQTVSGAAHWNATTHHIDMTTPSTVKLTTTHP